MAQPYPFIPLRAISEQFGGVSCPAVATSARWGRSPIPRWSIDSQSTLEATMKNFEANMACVAHGCQQYKSEQGSPYTPAISAETVGAKSLFFGVVTIPPGERTKAHIH